MSEYPYLAAVLPSLTFGCTSFPTPEQFLDNAEKWLSDGEYSILASVGFDDYRTTDHGLELVRDYCRFERLVREDVAAFVESRRQGHDHKTLMFPTSVLKDLTPLEAERRLLRLRWDFITSRMDSHFWDLHALVVYHIQLQILQRLSFFDKEKGRERFDGLAGAEGVAEKPEQDT